MLNSVIINVGGSVSPEQNKKKDAAKSKSGVVSSLRIVRHQNF
jgi:hypothetical protein